MTRRFITRFCVAALLVAAGATSSAVAQDTEQVWRYRRPVVRVGQDYTLRADDAVRDVTTVLGDVTIEGRVDEDVVVVLGTLHLTSTARVGGSVVAVAGSATIDKGATIGRDLAVIAGVETAPPDFAPEGEHIVIGNVGIAHALQGFVPWVMRGLLWGRLIVPDLAWIWMALGVIFVLYLIINTVFDKPVRACATAVVERPLSAFLLGLLVLVLAVPALVILAATVVGVLVIPFVLCAMVIGALIGRVGVIRAIGWTVLPEDESTSRARAVLALTIGFAMLVVIYMVPVIAIVGWSVVGVFGVGAASSTLRGALRREQPPKPPALVDAPPIAAAAAMGTPQTFDEPVFATAAPAADIPPASAPFVATPPPPRPAAIESDLTTFPRATFLDRIMAFALDAILVAITAQLLDLSRHDGWFPLALLAYHIAFWAWRGTTLGGIVIGLRVTRVNGTDLRFVDALVRGLSSVFSIAALGIGCFWMLIDPERQMWHDKIAGTLVVKVPRHLVLP